MMILNAAVEANKIIAQTLANWIWSEDNERRIKNYKKYDEYYNGDHEVKIPPDIRDVVKDDFDVISNYCKTVVDKAVGYLCSSPISLEVVLDTFGFSEEQLAKEREREKEAERLLYRIYRRNEFLKKNIIKLIRILSKKGDVFIKCYVDETAGTEPEDKIKLKVLKPEIVFPKFKDDDYEEYEYIAIIYDRRDELGNIYKYAQVFWPDVIREYKSEGGGRQWVQIGEDKKNELGMIPIVHIKNTEDELPWGRSDIEDVMSLQDAINKCLTDLLYNADYQAFQRVIVTGHSEPAQDDEGGIYRNRITKRRGIGAGTILCVPTAESKVYIVEPADSTRLIEIVKTIRQEISANGRVPQIALSQADGAGAASSLSLRIHYQPLDEKCNEKAALVASGLQQLNRIIFELYKKMTKEDFTDMETDIRFSKSMPRDRKEEAEIQEIEDRNKWKSKETIRTERGIPDPEEEKEKILAEMEEYRDDLYGQRVEREIENLLGGAGEEEEES